MSNTIFCPECKTEIDNGHDSCPICGYPIVKNDNQRICPECGHVVIGNECTCPKCGYPFSNTSSIMISKKHKLIVCTLIIFGILFAGLTLYSLFSGDFSSNAKVISNLRSNIQDYEDEKQLNTETAYSYKSGLFRSSYLNIADGYQKLIDDSNNKIAALIGKQIFIVIRTVILLLLAIGCIITALV